MDLKSVDQIIGKYDGEDSWLVMILQDVQDKYNYLPECALGRVAESLKIPLSRVHSVATFYSSFSLAERGRHLIRVCDGTACHLRGFTHIKEEISRHLGISEGQTTKDKVFTLDVVACLGACALAPVMAVDGRCYGNMNAEKVRVVLDLYRREKRH
ncbi:MAG: NADH-quinone oxidoreductase subunit NuoE [Phycisphaerales bacterium]|nr:MAG: NADH-quinone oxidoreductase subunit NuoE [Phycisphaerales bacterium]